MYCPNCGQSNGIEQRFCRKCGLNLEAVGVSLSKQLEGGKIEPVDRRLELFGNIAFAGLGTMVLFGIAALIYIVLEETVFSGNNTVFGVALSLFLVFAAMTLAYVVINESRKDKIAKHRQEPVLTPVETAKLLVDPPFEAVPSVVDDTTELLRRENRTHKL